MDCLSFRIMAYRNTSTSPVRIVGIGSAHGADQIGWLAARQLDAAGLKESYPENLLDIDICESPVLLVTQCSARQALILLDAYCSGEPVGSVRRFTVEDLDTAHRPASSHGIDLKQALALRKSLEGGNPPVSIIGICIGTEADAAANQTPGEVLEKTFPALLDAIDKDIQEFITSASTAW